jgi:hypothetical protein
MLQETTKQHLGTNGVEWVHLVRNIFATSVHQDSANSPEKKFYIFLLAKGFQKAPKDNQISSNGVERMHMV